MYIYPFSMYLLGAASPILGTFVAYTNFSVSVRIFLKIVPDKSQVLTKLTPSYKVVLIPLHKDRFHCWYRTRQSDLEMMNGGTGGSRRVGYLWCHTILQSD